jgi:Zinc carboxypeptidase
VCVECVCVSGQSFSHFRMMPSYIHVIFIYCTYICICVTQCQSIVYRPVYQSQSQSQSQNWQNWQQHYHTTTDVLNTLEKVPNEFVFKTGTSLQGRPLYALRLTPNAPRSAPKVLLVAGEHAREFIVVESALALTRLALLQSQSHSPSHSRSYSHSLPQSLSQSLSEFSDSSWRHQLFSIKTLALFQYLSLHLDIYVIPLLNPDGKVHLEESDDYCWRNNARGVDLNRNCDWEYGNEQGSSSDRNSEEYRGTAAFSEPETRFVRDVAKSLSLTAFISLHSGEQQIFVPFVDTVSKSIRRRRPTTDTEVHIVTQWQQISRGYFRNESGIAYEYNKYTADGTIFDYMAGVLHVPYVFCIEAYGGEAVPDCFVQFNPHTQHMPAVRDNLVQLYLEGLTLLPMSSSAADQ